MPSFAHRAMTNDVSSLQGAVNSMGYRIEALEARERVLEREVERLQARVGELEAEVSARTGRE